MTEPTFEEKQEAHRQFTALLRKMELENVVTRISGLTRAFKRFSTELKIMEIALAEMNSIFGKLKKGGYKDESINKKNK